MTSNAVVQLLFYLTVLLVVARPLGSYMALVYDEKPSRWRQAGEPVERLFYRLYGIDASVQMTWFQYALAVLAFSTVSFLSVYLLQRCQGWLPLNPQQLGAISPDSAYNTAISFTTNTNWQGYGGEVTMSYFTQMLGLTVQNFVSAAVGMAVLMTLIRGFRQASVETIGNFWVDLTRGTLYILLPLSLACALLLVSQGVVQTFSSYQNVPWMDPASAPAESAKEPTGQVLPLGPAASQIAIKQLGTNGGGFFNVNSAHPFENPTPLSNFFEMLAILLIPAALCFTFGEMVGDWRQGVALLAVMLVVLLPLTGACVVLEQQGTPQLAEAGANLLPGDQQAGGNMEGKETRFGIVNSALWATVTTAASSGSVNSMHDSMTPLGGLIPMWLMQLGEIIFGGVGSGLYGLLLFAIIAVFITGLMVGRTPEYLGKKIEAFEMKMAMIAVLVPCAIVLVGTAVAVVCDAGLKGMANPGPHGFSEVLYAYSSAANNNGSAFAGLGANTPFYNVTLGLAMLAGRFVVMLCVLAIAGSLAMKKRVPPSAGTLPTHTPLFVSLLVAVVIVLGALTFFPALALGPIVEHLQMTAC